MSENRIRVTKCAEDCCPFFYNDASYDSPRNECNLDQKVIVVGMLHRDKRVFPENCPLKKGPVVVEVAE